MDVVLFSLILFYRIRIFHIAFMKVSQRSCEIKHKNYFCICQKDRQKYNQHFKLLFFTISLHFGRSNQISTYRKINLSPVASSIYLVFLPLEM